MCASAFFIYYIRMNTLPEGTVAFDSLFWHLQPHLYIAAHIAHTEPLYSLTSHILHTHKQQKKTAFVRLMSNKKDTRKRSVQ